MIAMQKLDMHLDQKLRVCGVDGGTAGEDGATFYPTVSTEGERIHETYAGTLAEGDT